MILLISLTILLSSIGYLIQVFWIMKLEKKLTKITINHHGRIKNLEERVKKLEENFEENSFENISMKIGKICINSEEKSENFKK